MMKITKILPVFGMVVFVYLVWKIGLSEIISSLEIVNWPYFLLALFVVFFVTILQAYKWGRILLVQGYMLNFLTVLRIHLIGLFYGFVTPARAGLMVRSVYLKKLTGKSLVKSSSNTIVEKMLDIISILTFAFVGVLIFLNLFVDNLLPLFLIFLFFILLCVLIFNRFYLKRILKKIYIVFLPRRFKKKARFYFSEFYSEFPPMKKLIWPFLLTLVSWGLIYTIVYFVALSMGLVLPYYVFLFLFPIPTLLGMLPISPSGLGVREATVVGLLSFFGVAPGFAFVLSILSLMVGNLLPALFGLVLSFSYKV